jgi:hypothetical protein
MRYRQAGRVKGSARGQDQWHPERCPTTTPRAGNRDTPNVLPLASVSGHTKITDADGARHVRRCSAAGCKPPRPNPRQIDLMSETSRHEYRAEAHALAAIGQVLALATLPTVDVTLPRDLAERAVAAWHRDDDGSRKAEGLRSGSSAIG